ncbi:hypothetical protein [Piscinibacter koreensis]|uniref:Serine/threonine protein phosphatase n=1 Tax=Piscinibacter koreensis TaxID=2742824 RepID=A0A7Y6TYJ7_9BURK|nr:hypothetical protein [Schlegelella koreensis]NUZ08177.1 hypothetical protein [Schlegelella koreensis]
MSDVELEALRHSSGRPRRVDKLVLDGVEAVVKRQRPARGAWRARVVNALARAVGLPWLQAVPAHGGLEGQAVELRRLAGLATAGVRVPRVLHVDPTFFVMERLPGHSLVKLIERAAPGQRVGPWKEGLAAIADVHARGQYLSQAFARNFIATPSGLAMIDFEDDPLEAMSLEDAQARDWLAYLHSTLWLLDAPAAITRAAFEAALAPEAASIRNRVHLAAKRLGGLRRLPTRRRPWGREVVSLQALGALLASPPVSTRHT